MLHRGQVVILERDLEDPVKAVQDLDPVLQVGLGPLPSTDNGQQEGGKLIVTTSESRREEYRNVGVAGFFERSLNPHAERFAVLSTTMSSLQGWRSGRREGVEESKVEVEVEKLWWSMQGKLTKGEKNHEPPLRNTHSLQCGRYYGWRLNARAPGWARPCCGFDYISLQADPNRRSSCLMVRGIDCTEFPINKTINN